MKELRQATGLSQEAFADRCGFARSYMSRIERGEANPSVDAIEVLSRALKVKPAELFAEHGSLVASAKLVPFAKDGSYFGRSTFRPQTKEYNVGGKGKGNTKRFSDFEDALTYLRTMKSAKWWRPNEKGDWGLVTAVRWAPDPDEFGGNKS